MYSTKYSFLNDVIKHYIDHQDIDKALEEIDPALDLSVRERGSNVINVFAYMDHWYHRKFVRFGKVQPLLSTSVVNSDLKSFKKLVDPSHHDCRIFFRRVFANIVEEYLDSWNIVKAHQQYCKYLQRYDFQTKLMKVTPQDYDLDLKIPKTLL